MSAPQRVLEVFGPSDGGVPEHVLGLVRGLAGTRFELEVAAPAGSAVEPALRELGVPIHPLPFSRLPRPRDVGTARALRALDERRGYGVVHAHSSKAGALVRGALPRPQRLVYTPHCFAFLAGFGRADGIQRAGYRAVEQLLVSRTGVLVAVSAWEAREGARALRGLASRTEVIHNGVAEPPAVAPDPELAAFRGDGPLLGSVARLDAQKDPLALVEAAAVLRDRGQLDFRIALVGNGSLADDVDASIAAHGLEGRVRRFPFRPPSARFLATLDAMVLPSRWESFPISVLEAMAVGRAVIATDVGGTAEAVEHGTTGWLVAPGDPEALADRLREAADDLPGLRAMGESARRRYEAQHREADMAARVAELYERVADVAR